MSYISSTAEYSKVTFKKQIFINLNIMLNLIMTFNVSVSYSQCPFKVHLWIYWICPTAFLVLSHLYHSHKKKENLSWIQYNNQYKKFQIAVWTDCFVFWLKNTSLLLVCDYGFIDLCWVLIFTLNCTFYLLLLKTLANKLT